MITMMLILLMLMMILVLVVMMMMIVLTRIGEEGKRVEDSSPREE